MCIKLKDEMTRRDETRQHRAGHAISQIVIGLLSNTKGAMDFARPMHHRPINTSIVRSQNPVLLLCGRSSFASTWNFNKMVRCPR